MSLTHFIPEVWGKEMLIAVRKAHVYAPLCNRDYQGDIAAMGDTVRINAIGTITVNDYTKDTDIASPQALSDAQTVLTVSQAKYYNFAIDDVDAAQQNPKVMSEAMSYAGYSVADKVDQYVAGLYTDVASGNVLGTSGSPLVPDRGTSANIGDGATMYDYLVKLSRFLTQNSIPKSQRWAVIAPWMTELLTQDIRFTSFNTAAATQALAAGQPAGEGAGVSDAYLGRIGGMAVYESNNAPHTGGTVGASGSQDVVLAGHPMAITFADNLVQVEAYRPPTRFSDAVKGLHLYGAKVTRPYGIAVAYLQAP